MKKIICLLLILVVIPACIYFAIDRESIDIEEFRLNSGYQEVNLSNGITTYKAVSYTHLRAHET